MQCITLSDFLQGMMHEAGCVQAAYPWLVISEKMQQCIVEMKEQLNFSFADILQFGMWKNRDQVPKATTVPPTAILVSNVTFS